MRKFGDVIHFRDRDDFSDPDHREYVESGTRDILLIGGMALLLIGAFIGSLLG
jgi:hypothetical protein